MATPAQLAAKLGTLLTAIKTKLNGKLDATARAADSSKLEGFTLAQVQAKTVSETLIGVNGRRGEAAFFGQEGTPMALAGGELLNKMRMASDDSTIATLKTDMVSFADVFNNWLRISHGGNKVYPNTPSELSSWAYDSATDKISSTINSVSLIGLIGPDRFDDYTFETIFTSTASDDDTIGMCLAFKKANGMEHTLNVLVSPGGNPPQGGGSTTQLPVIWVSVNFNQGVANGQQVLWSQELGLPRSGWNGGAAVAAGVRVKAVRKKTGIIEITCTRADGSAWPTPVFATINIPALFLSPCQIGYMACSQDAATWSNITVPTSRRDIIDTRDLTVWRFTNNVWANAGKANDPNVLMPGRMYKNTEGDKAAYYLDFEGNFITLGASNLS